MDGDLKSVVVKEAALDDAALIADLTRASWADKVDPTSTGHRETAERVLADMKQGGGFILLVNGKPSGSVRWLPIDGASNVWEVRRMGILPTCRGRNLSQYLLEAMIHSALASGIRELRLGVRADQPRLLDFYAVFGFEPAPELEYPHFHNPLEQRPIMMRRFFEH